MTAPVRTGIIGFGLGGSVFHGPLLAADPAYRVDAIVTAAPIPGGDRHHRVDARPVS